MPAGRTGCAHVVLRYFNVAGADPQGRSGQSTRERHAPDQGRVQTALGARPYLEVFGTDYPTPDGSCMRDYIQVTDLAGAHLDALAHLRAGGESLTLNCGYGRGYSVLEVIEAVKRVSGARLRGAAVAAPAGRSGRDRRQGRPDPRAARLAAPHTMTSTRSSPRRSPGNGPESPTPRPGLRRRP